MRNRSRVLDLTDFHPCGSQCADRRLTARTRTADADFDATHAVIARLVGGVLCGLLSGERSALTRTAETKRARALPGNHVAVRIRDRHQRVVERRKNRHNPMRDVLAFLLLELLASLTFFIRCTCTGCSCWFRHNLCLRRRLLLVSHRTLARALAGA